MSAPPAVAEGQNAAACMVALHPAGLRVLAVGGGAVAARKLAPYLAGGARVRVIAPAVDEALAAAVTAAGGVVERREFAEGDVDDAQVVFAATSRREVNARVAAAAIARHRLVNVADDSAPSSFSSAATLDRDGLVVGVHAGGVPDAARRVRDALGARLGAGYGEALAFLRTARRAAITDGDRERWDRARRELVGADFCETVESGRFMERADAWR